MIRSANAASEQDDEAVMQNFLFKVNLLLFVGTIGVIKAGTFFYFPFFGTFLS